MEKMKFFAEQSGKAERCQSCGIPRKQAKSKEMIWREGDTQYYPGGVTDPNYCVLKFTATDGRFYSDFYPRSFVI